MNEQQHLLTLIWNNDPTSLSKELGKELDKELNKEVTEELAENGFDIRGINIYRRNLLANAQRALSISFPTIFKLLDNDVSEQLVHIFLKQCPPHQGDWTQWGAEFPQFIAVDQITREYAYLPDCAELDWYVHSALHGPDQTVDYTTLALLGSAEPENITVILNQNVGLIKTELPISEIFNAHHHQDEQQRKNAMEQAKSALASTRKKHVVMIFRPEFQPKVTILTNSEAEFMFCLKAGKSLATSLDAVSHYDDFSFEKWLLKAIEQNLILHFKEN